MLDKNKLKKACDELGLEIEFNSDKAGFYSAKDDKLYTFEELSKLVDKYFPKDEV
ncbi:MAG: hypothetical protein [Bacteriophage sp.]|nr:MAG: hypothetical protein [Bacteriophage sp.]